MAKKNKRSKEGRNVSTATDDKSKGATSASTPDAEPSEQMEQPPIGDVDVADLSTRHHKGEKHEPILEGYWIKIGEHDDVDEKYWHHLAAVIKSRHIRCQCNWSDGDHEHQDPDSDLLVRTRDEYNAQIRVPLDAVEEMAQDRATLHPYA